MDLRRPLGNVYATIAMLAIFLSSIITLLPFFRTLGVLSPCIKTRESIISNITPPLYVIAAVSGILVILRLLGVPFLPSRGVFLNVVTTTLVTGLLIASVFFIIQPNYAIIEGDSFSPSESNNLTGLVEEKCYFIAIPYTITYMTSGSISLLYLIWRLFGGSF